MSSYTVLDEALESISSAGPELANGLTNHAPMAVEALCAMGRGDAVLPWLDGYRRGMVAWPAPQRRISATDWRLALGRFDCVADWRAFFVRELQEAPWRDVVSRWTSRLMAGFCAGATHGIIRVGHAARALAVSESRPRIRELADGLAYWAATYQVLPSDPSANPSMLSPREAILNVPMMPLQQRKFTGMITSSLEALDEFDAFAPVFGIADLGGDLAEEVSHLTELFARVYLANAHDLLSTIVFIHGVTSIAAMRALLSYLEQETAYPLLRYAWQAGCALYATFGLRPVSQVEDPPPEESFETLVDLAVDTGDEHAIKFTEACIGENIIRESSVYLSAARHAIGVLAA